MHWFDVVTDTGALLAAVATAVGVFLAYRQLRQTSRQARTSFEDSLSQQYRQLLAQLPVSAMLGAELAISDVKANLGAFFRYFDLSNEQAFLHSRGRVGDETWNDWREGIQQNLRLPAFRSAWSLVRRSETGSFDDLARLVGEPTRPGEE